MQRWVRSLLLCALATLALAAPARAATAYGDEKSGPVMLNLKGGASIPLYVQGGDRDDLPTSGVLQLELGFALDRERRAYLVVPLEAHIGVRSSGNDVASASLTFARLLVPVGFQYDIPLGRSGLFLSPRISAGYVAYITRGMASLGSASISAEGTRHGGVIAPELGLKYVVNGRFNIGIEPFSLPIFLLKDDDDLRVLLDYRIRGYVGVNF